MPRGAEGARVRELNPPADSEHRGSRSWSDRPLVVALGFLVATIVLTWPLAAGLGSTLPAGYRDVWQNVWNFWWWKTALVDLGQSPYATHHLFFPYGADLAFHTHSELNQLAFLPVSLAFGAGAAHNAAILSGFAISGFGAWLLARRVGAEPTAAVLAGCVFAFVPYRTEQSLEHLNLASTEFLPIAAWAMIGLVERPSIGRGALLGASFAANALVCWHYGLFAVLLLPALLAGAWLGGETRGRFREIVVGAAVAAAVATVLLAPFAWPIVRGITSGEPYVKAPVEKGIDALFLFVPPRAHPLFGPFVAGVYERVRWSPTPGFTVYLGFVPLLLAVAAIRGRRSHRALTWMAIGAGALLLALGTHPRIAGVELPIPFPHALLEMIPGLRVLRVANRFFVVFVLAFSVLAALGASRIARPGLVAIACLATLFEYLWLPYPVQPYTEAGYAPVYARLASYGAVLDLPFSTGVPKCLRNQALQTAHGRPIAGGYVSVTPARAAAALRRDPVLGALVLPQTSPPPVPDWPKRARQIGFTIVALHKDPPLVDDDSHRREVERRCALEPGLFEALSEALVASVGPPAYEDDRLRLFRLP